MPERLDEPPEIGHREGQAEGPRRRLRLAHPGEERDYEDDVPDRRQRPHGARPLAAGGVETEERLQPDQGLSGGGALVEEEKHDDERDDPADIAEGEAGPGDLAHVLVPREIGHEGIGEDCREFHADQAQPEPQHRHKKVGFARQQIPEHPRPEHIEAREEPYPDHAPAGAVGDGAENRGKERDDDPGHGLSPAPVGLRGSTRRVVVEALTHEMRARHLGEIGAEDEGQQKRVVGLARPVEEPPAPDAPPRRDRHALPLALRR